jgi:hypothetical protein
MPMKEFEAALTLANFFGDAPIFVVVGQSLAN